MSIDADVLTAFLQAFDSSTPKLNLSEAVAIEGVLPQENGGSGNKLGLVTGLGEYVVPHLAGLSLSGLSKGQLVTAGDFEGWVLPTTGVGQAVVGVMSDDVLDQAVGLAQTDGLAYVLVASAVARGDRVRASATTGKAETSPYGLNAFGTARTASDGTGVWVFLTIGDESIGASTFDHRYLRGVPGLNRHADLLDALLTGTDLTVSGYFTGTGQSFDPATLVDNDASTYVLFNGTPTTCYIRADLGSGWGRTFKAGGCLLTHKAVGVGGTVTIRIKANTTDSFGTATTIATFTIATGSVASTDLRYWAAPGTEYRYWYFDLSSFPDRFEIFEARLYEAAGSVLVVTDPTTSGGALLDTALADVYAAIAAAVGSIALGGQLSGVTSAAVVEAIKGTFVTGTPGASGKFLRSTGSATAGWANLVAGDIPSLPVASYPYHDEVLTDGASNIIYAGGDVVMVVGVPN